MTADAALKAFVSENLELLTAVAFDKRTYKQRHNDYFYRKHGNKFGRPSPSDVALATIDYLRNRGVSQTEMTDVLVRSKFFEQLPDKTREKLQERASLTSTTSGLSSDAMSSIRANNQYDAILKHRTNEITQEAQKELVELKRQIEEKKTEYESLPSLLDGTESLAEPDVDPEADARKPWWQRFYLRADPFLGKDGLSSISEDLYDQVIIKTAPFREIASNLDRNPDYLFGGGFLLAGGYGYGKTTLIDYLAHLLINRNVIPIRIACGRAFLDSAGFADSFYQRLRKELRDEAAKTSAVVPPSVVDLEVEDQIVELARAIGNLKNGVVVFLDDYHKHRSHFQKIFEFLGTLQVLKDELFRKSVKVGFVVSGLPTWLPSLRSDGQLSGFLDRPPVELPQITPELLCEVFNRRIAAFCYDKSPRSIKADFVRRLVRELEGKAGFRDYLGKIVEELSSNNQAIVDSPLEIAENVLSEIRAAIESDHVTKTAINKLLFGSRFKKFNEQQIARSLELLVFTAIQNGISEDDVRFVDNKYHFLTLRDCSLIQKQRSVRGNICEWGLQTKLRRAFEDVAAKYRYYPSDYLLKIYAYKDYGARQGGTAIQDNSETAELRRLSVRFARFLSKSVSSNIQTGLQAYDALTMSDGKVRSDVHQQHRALSAVEALSQALFEIDGSEAYFRRAEVSDLRLRWSLHPFSDEAIQEMFTRFDDQAAEPNSAQKVALALKQSRNVLNLISAHLCSLIEDICSHTDSSFLTRPTVHDEKGLSVLRSVRELAYSSRREDHFLYVRRITDYLELFLRKFLFVTCRSLRGDDYFDMCPELVRKYAYKNLENRESYAVEVNKFDGLTRSQLRSIFTDGGPIRDHIISALQLVWKRDDWETFASVFAVENIKSAHLQIDAFSPAERQRYLRYCAMVEEFVAAANTAMARLVQSSVFCSTMAIPTPEFLPCHFRVALRTPELKDGERGRHTFSEWPKSLGKPHIVDHVIRSADAERIVTMILSKIEGSSGGVVTEDLLDLEYISTHYRTRIVDLLCVLAYEHHVTGRLSVQAWFGSSIAVRRTATGSASSGGHSFEVSTSEPPQQSAG